MGRAHAPSQFRGIQRDVRRATHGLAAGRSLGDLQHATRNIADPGHRAIAWAALTEHPGASTKEAAQFMEEAVRAADEIDVAWRLVETAHELLRRLPVKATSARSQLLDAVIARADPDVLIEALPRLIRVLHADEMAPLWERALKIRPTPRPELRALLRRWGEVLADDQRAGWITQRSHDLDQHAEPTATAPLHAELGRWSDPGQSDGTDEAAAEHLTQIDDRQQRLQALRSLLAPIDDHDRLATYLVQVEEWSDPVARIEAMLAVIGRQDRAGDDTAPSRIRRIVAAIDQVDDDAERVRLLVQWAKSMAHLTDADLRQALDALQGERDGIPEDTKEARRLDRTLRELDPTIISSKPVPREEKTDKTAPTDDRARHALALCDTYEGHLGKTHMQSVARAAPLCDAFGLDLVLVGFPTEDLDALVERATRETNIGDAGRHVTWLHAAGRIHLVPVTDAHPPSQLSRFGVPVVTTPTPKRSRKVRLDDAALRSTDPGGRICLIMGMGRHGLPAPWLDEVKAQYEITGRDVSLETATAMGILADRLGQVAVGRTEAAPREASPPKQTAPATKRAIPPAELERQEAAARARDAAPRPRRSQPPRGHPKRRKQR